MSYHKTVDPWQEAANAVQGIEGAQLKCSGKTGAWTLSGETVDTGREGLMIAVIMSTALHGPDPFRRRRRHPEARPLRGRRARPGRAA